MVDKYEKYTGQISNVSVVYNVYRIVLPLIVLITYFTSPETSRLGEVDPALFVQVSAIYAIFGIVITFFVPTAGKYLERPQVLAGTLLVDIFAISLLNYSSGGLASGLGLLLIVTIASGSIMI